MRFVTVCASVVLLTLGTLPVNALPINNPNRTDAGLTPVAQNTTKRSEPQLLGIGSSNNVPNGYGYLQPGIGGNNVPYGYGYLQPGNNNNPSQSGGYISNIMNSIFQIPIQVLAAVGNLVQGIMTGNSQQEKYPLGTGGYGFLGGYRTPPTIGFPINNNI